MSIEKSRQFKKLKKTLDVNKNEKVTLTNKQKTEIDEERNDLISIENDEYEDEPSIWTSESKSLVNFSDRKNDVEKADKTVCGKPLIYSNNNNAGVIKISDKHLEQSTNTNKDFYTIINGNNAEVMTTLNSSVEDTSIDSENPIEENGNGSNKLKYDLSIYDYDEDSSSEESQTAGIKCKLCTLIVETPMDLLKHKRDAHKIQKISLPLIEVEKYFDYPDRTFCPICGQPIKSRNFRSAFIKHLLVHSTGITHDCRICKRKFRRLDHMRSHERRHVLTYAELRAIEDTVDNNPVQMFSFRQ